MSKQKNPINYKKVLEMGKDNHQFLVDITRSYIESLQTFKKIYKDALQQQDIEAFRDATHKIKGSMSFLEAWGLIDEIDKYRSRLYSGQADSTLTHSSIIDVTTICDDILQILYQYQKEFENR